MKIKRIFNLLFLFGFINFLYFINRFQTNFFITLLMIAVLTINFLVFNIIPFTKKSSAYGKIGLMGGRELLIVSPILFSLEIIFCLFVLLSPTFAVPKHIAIINGIIAAVALLILTWNGILRSVILSNQLGILSKILLVFMWWIPVVNFFIFLHSAKILGREYRFQAAKEELNYNRKDSGVCKTKYPILLVHGIFWRDWQAFNYWGRIPKELSRNGAVLYYGNHQSSAPMEMGALELKAQILKILEKEKCEKVNIIAHSKGGLDARYAVSRLGIQNCVASLTTVGAPHRGCALVDKLLKIVPDKLVRFFSRQYGKLYRKLGDKNPDFYVGVHDLTTASCRQFNAEVPNAEGVVYQSVASQVSGFWSSGFPLNVGYLMFPKTEKENDGFVSVKSAMWGNFLGSITTKKTRGVSHGDTIDLMREDVPGFDVCEYYVELLKGLKERGL